MNPNDLISQMQELLHQAILNARPIHYIILVIGLAVVIGIGYVTFLFYARLRDIARELKLFRIYYKSAHPLGQDESEGGPKDSLPF